MFKESEETKELCYETEKRLYYLFQGYTNNGLNSDIVFITYITKDYDTKFVGFVYGGFSDLQAIEETIKYYEEKEN